MYIFVRLLLTIILLSEVCKSEKVRYISTEHPRVLYFNPKYLTFANLTSQRYGRSDPFYYVGLHFISKYELRNNVSVHFIFYEFLTNRYRRGFVEMHFKWCDLMEKDMFFGTALRQGKLRLPCPHPAGEYHLYNMTIPLKHIPRNFPFTKGRIFCNLTTAAEEPMASGHIDMEIKETHIRKRN